MLCIDDAGSEYLATWSSSEAEVARGEVVGRLDVFEVS
jgi:hypothetical protein